MMAGGRSHMSFLAPIEGPGSGGNARHGRRREESREFQLSRKCEFEKRHPHGRRISRQQWGWDAKKWQRRAELAESESPPEKICIRSKQSFSFVSSSSSSPACQASRMELRLPPAWSRHPPLMLEGPLWRCTTFDTHCPDVAQQWETVQHRTKSTSKMTTWEVRWVLCALPYKFRVQHHLTENNLCSTVALF